LLDITVSQKMVHICQNMEDGSCIWITCNSTILCAIVGIHKIILLHDCETWYFAWYWINEVCHSLMFISNDKKALKNSLCHLMQRKSKILFKILQVCGSLFCLFHLWSLSAWTKLLLRWLWLNRQLFFWDMTLHHWVRATCVSKEHRDLIKHLEVQKDEPVKPWEWKLLSKLFVRSGTDYQVLNYMVVKTSQLT